MSPKPLPSYPLEVVAIPLDLVWQDPNANLARMEEALGKLPPAHGPRLVVFPELTLTGFTTVNPLQSALDSDSPILAQARGLARQFKTSILFGFPEKMASGKVRNALCYINRDGIEIGRYHKLHLFTQGAHPETATYEPGDTPIFVEDGEWRIGLSICFDLRFPELYRAYQKAACDLIVLSACWVGGPTKNDQFLALSAGGAVASQSFVVALNRTGTDPFCTFEGEAYVHGPRAEALARNQNQTTFVMLDPALLQAARGLSVQPSLKERYSAQPGQGTAN